jgi:hypothetical protein
MADLPGTGFELVEMHKLYACLDRLLEHKRAFFDHLTTRWKDLFNLKFEVLLYDLTNTSFESDPPFADDDKRKYGYSKRQAVGLCPGGHCADCPVVVEW